jgi:hypothetical protein
MFTGRLLGSLSPEMKKYLVSELKRIEEEQPGLVKNGEAPLIVWQLLMGAQAHPRGDGIELSKELEEYENRQYSEGTEEFDKEAWELVDNLFKER